MKNVSVKPKMLLEQSPYVEKPTSNEPKEADKLSTRGPTKKGKH
jgi:hypothetical protein